MTRKADVLCSYKHECVLNVAANVSMLRGDRGSFTTPHPSLVQV